MSVSVVFAGTPEFAEQALRAILAAGYRVPLVLTQPDRPAGRGMRLLPSPVKKTALEADIPVMQPVRLRLQGEHAEQAQAVRAQLERVAPDVLVVAAYGLILPQWVLDLPRYGCLNIHASLLPRWRGAAPIQRAIDAGDAHTGITIMQMDAGLDTGPMLLQRAIPITEQHTAGQLHDELAELGAQCIVEALQLLSAGRLVATPQPTEGITYAEKLQRSESAINYHWSAARIARRIRAFNPFPGSTTQLPDIKGAVKVWAAHAVDEEVQGAPGTVVRVHTDSIDMATGAGILRITELQRPGGRRQSAAQFIPGWSYAQRFLRCATR